MTLPTELINEKNKLWSEHPLIMLLEVDHEDIDAAERPLRLARNIQDVLWNGQTWQKFAFNIGVINQSAEGKLPELIIQVQNVNRVIQWHCEQANGLMGAEVNLYLISAGHLDQTTPLYEMFFYCIKTAADATWVTFHLGLENPFGLRWPASVFAHTKCHYREFKGTQCGYTGSLPACSFTWATCRIRSRFGGQPALANAVFEA